MPATPDIASATTAAAVTNECFRLIPSPPPLSNEHTRIRPSPLPRGSGESSGGSTHRHREPVHPPHEGRTYPVRLTGNLEVSEALEQLVEQHARLEPREGRAEAEMLAEPERHVRRIHPA